MCQLCDAKSSAWMPRRGFPARRCGAPLASRRRCSARSNVGPSSALAQPGAGRRTRDRRHAGIRQAAGEGARARDALAPESHPQLQRLRAISARLIAQSAPVERPRAAVALGGQPDRQQADQCVLHAGRQDRRVHRHARSAAAHRRRDGHGGRPRDGARAARTRPRAHRQEPGHRHAAVARRATAGAGPARATWRPASAPSC